MLEISSERGSKDKDSGDIAARAPAKRRDDSPKTGHKTFGGDSDGNTYKVVS